jgi:D-lyxose ketol-isomerase
MITRSELAAAQARAVELLKKTGLAFRPDELAHIEVADFGLGELESSGAQIVTLANTDKIAVKLLALMPGQVLPEHAHPRLGEYEGKEETLRCAWGEVYIYGPGEPTPNPKGQPPARRRHTYTMWHETILRPGDQITFQPSTPHWFQAGPTGAVVWSFSTKAVDIQDVFTDAQIARQTVIVEE